jgi:hypothetical protein
MGGDSLRSLLIAEVSFVVVAILKGRCKWKEVKGSLVPSLHEQCTPVMKFSLFGGDVSIRLKRSRKLKKLRNLKKLKSAYPKLPQLPQAP